MRRSMTSASGLQRTRWPEKEPVGDWVEWGSRWRTSRSWPAIGKSPTTCGASPIGLNRYEQFVTTDRRGRHPLPARPPRQLKGRRRAIMTHGWPGSVIEFTKVIDPLVDPVSFGGKASDALEARDPFAARPRVERQADRDPAGASRRSRRRGLS